MIHGHRDTKCFEEKSVSIFFNEWSNISPISLNEKFYVRAEILFYFPQGEIMEEMETRESLSVQSAVKLHYISKNSLPPWRLGGGEKRNLLVVIDTDYLL